MINIIKIQMILIIYIEEKIQEKRKMRKMKI